MIHRYNIVLAILIQIFCLCVSQSAQDDLELMPKQSQASSVSSTSIKIFNKTICTCEMELNEVEYIACPSGYYFNILNAYLFDFGKSKCSIMPTAPIRISDIKDDIQDFCKDVSNCTISYRFLIDLVNQPSYDCLGANLFWSCYRTTTYTTSHDLPSNYSFTYFFYIITLVLSSSCILVGGLFILRKFLISRRNVRRVRRNRNMNASEANINSVWTTSSYPPPSYENIYDSSLPIVNSPPDYDSAQKSKLNFANSSNNTSANNSNKQEPIVVYRSSNTSNSAEPQQEANQQEAQTDNITTVMNPLFNLDITNANSNSHGSNEDEVTIEFKSDTNQINVNNEHKI